MTNIDFETIVYNNAISDCVTAYNWICDDFNYDEDKIYHYNEVLEQMYYRLEAELSTATIEDIITDFMNLDTPIGLLQDSFFTFDGYGNLSEIEDDTIREYLIDFLNDYYDDITDTYIFDILGIDYE